MVCLLVLFQQQTPVNSPAWPRCSHLADAMKIRPKLYSSRITLTTRDGPLLSRVLKCLRLVQVAAKGSSIADKM